MKANVLSCKDLMVGDWVRIRISQHNTKVTNIDANSVYTEAAFPIRYDEIEPIPLTAEILEKNGWRHEFDKIDYMVKYDLGNEGKDCWMMWAIKEHNLDIQRQDENLDMYNLKVSRVVTPSDYVHQLQHALRLCGITREIIL